MSSTKTDHKIVFVKNNLPCDKACDIVKPMHFYVHKKIFGIIFVIFFYAVNKSLAFLSHRLFDIVEGTMYGFLTSTYHCQIICDLLV